MLRVRNSGSNGENMSTQDRILDDVARVAGAAMGVLNGAKEQAGKTARTCVDSLAHEMDLVPREDFEKLEMLVEALQTQQKKLEDRIEELEKLASSTKKK